MKAHKRLLAAVLAVLILTAFSALKPVTAASGAGDANYLHYWSFDDNADDASGVLHIGPANQAAYTEGVHGKALNTYEGSALKSEKLTENTLRGFTMGAWFNLNSDAREWNIIMSKGNTADAQTERYQIHIGHASEENGGGYLLAYAPVVGGALSTEEDGVFVPFDTWTYVAVSFNGSEISMYVNGEYKGGGPALSKLGASISGYNTVTVGALNHDAKTFRFCGLIDDAFYANYPMTADDIKAAYEDNTKLKAWSDGSAPIVPDQMAETPTEAPQSTAGTPSDSDGNLIYFWPFENSTTDLSHKELKLDIDDMVDGYVEGKAGKAAEVSLPMMSETLPGDIDLSEFTVALWVRWVENSHGSYTVPIAIAGKETNHHFELYFTVDGDAGELAFYSTANGWNVEHIAPVAREDFVHIAAVNGGGEFRLYLNGELVYQSGRQVVMRGLGTTDDFISLGGLTDATLTCTGLYDEVLLANYALDDELVALLYSDPVKAHEEVMKLVEANYPEGYTAPTAVPTKAPTEEPVATAAPTPVPATEAAATAEPDKTPIPGKTAAPSGNGGSGVNPGIWIAVIAGVVIVAAGILAAVLLKRKKK